MGRSFLHLKKHMIRTLYCSPETLSLLKIHYSSLYHLHFKMSFYTVLFVLNIMSGIGFQLSQYFLRVGYWCIKSIITSFGYRKTMNSIIRDAKARQNNGVSSSYKKKDNFGFSMTLTLLNRLVCKKWTWTRWIAISRQKSFG